MSGNWHSIFNAAHDDYLQPLSAEEIQKRRLIHNQAYLKAAHLSLDTRMAEQVIESNLAFVNTEFFENLGLAEGMPSLVDRNLVVSASFAEEHRIHVGTQLSINNRAFEVAALIDNFAGIDGQTDIYINADQFRDTLYHELPDSIRDFISQSVAAFFYAEKNSAALQPDEQELSVLEGVAYNPEERRALMSLSQAILLTGLFLTVLFIITDYSLAIYWQNHLQGEWSLWITLGASRKRLIQFLLKVWALPRFMILAVAALLLPYFTALALTTLGYENLQFNSTYVLFAAVTLVVIYGSSSALTIRSILRACAQLTGSLKSLRSSTKRFPANQYLVWAGFNLVLLVPAIAALLLSSFQLSSLVQRDLHFDSDNLLVADFALQQGMTVDSSTQQRRQHTLEQLQSQLTANGIRAALTSTPPMRRSQLYAEISAVDGQSFQLPRHIALASVSDTYQITMQHEKAHGRWPETRQEVAVNEAFLQQFSITEGQLPEIWIQNERFQVTAIVKNSHWISPIASPQPMIWKPATDIANSLLVQWDGSMAEIQDLIENITRQIDNGIILEEVSSVDALRAGLLRDLQILATALMLVTATTLIICIGSLWVAINGWVASKKWALTVHIALGATRSFLRRALGRHIIWPLFSFLPLSFGAALFITFYIRQNSHAVQPIYASLLALVLSILIVLPVVINAYWRLTKLDASSLTKDVT